MRLSRHLLIWALSAFLLIPSGCATTPEKLPPVMVPKVFFPDPPGLPRIQFLRSFTSSKDIESPRSQFDRFVTGEEQRIKRIDKPYGVGIYAGKIYVCDSNSTVMVFDLKNKKFQELEGAKGLGKLVQPLNISIDSDGTKYVADPVRGQVVVYNREDFFVKAIGSPAEWTPIDAVPFDNKLYVIDKKSRDVWPLIPKAIYIYQIPGDFRWLNMTGMAIFWGLSGCWARVRAASPVPGVLQRIETGDYMWRMHHLIMFRSYYITLYFLKRNGNGFRF